MDVWCNQLSVAHRAMEEDTDIRGLDFNTEEVVEKDVTIQEKEKLYIELKNILAK